jgi:hypothetical protein
MDLRNTIYDMRQNIIITLLIIAVTIVSAKNRAGEKELVFKAGEALTYQVYYGPVNGGKATVTVEQAVHAGKEVLHVKVLGYTTGLADKLFRVYDVYESYIDRETGLPVKAIRNVSEGNYRYYNEVLYNRENNTVKSHRSGIVEVPDGIMDIVSAFYKLRDTMQVAEFQPYEVIGVDTYFKDKVFPVKVIFGGTETLETRLGSFNAIKLYPVSKPGKLFRSKNDITVWLSNDGNFVPLRVRMNMIVGSVMADLIEYEGLRY